MVHYNAVEHWGAKDLEEFEVSVRMRAKTAEEAAVLMEHAFDNYFLFEAKQVHFPNQGHKRGVSGINILVKKVADPAVIEKFPKQEDAKGFNWEQATVQTNGARRVGSDSGSPGSKGEETKIE